MVSKEFTPAYSQTMMVPIVYSNGKTTYTTMVPFLYHYDDDWEVTIQQYSEEESSMLSATYRVTQEVYDSVSIGDEFVYEKDMEPDTPQYTREEVNENGDQSGNYS